MYRTDDKYKSVKGFEKEKRSIYLAKMEMLINFAAWEHYLPWIARAQACTTKSDK